MRTFGLYGLLFTFLLVLASGCGGASDSKPLPPTKPDPTGTEGGRLPPKPKGA